jgi:NADPH2:quinone reductase
MSVPEYMTAMEIAQPGGPEMLRPVLRPTPKPGPDEVLIEVTAAGINRPDVLQRLGKYDPPPGTTDIPGLEVSGRIVALGAGVSGWEKGDRVCALLAGGGYAEYCVAPASQCLPIPDGLKLVEAAVVPETFFTVWSNVFDRGRLQSGESFLVHGGSSGIGTTAIQLAKAFGTRVFATAGSAEKCRACTELGADRAIDYREEDFVAVIKDMTDGKGVDVVLDMVGGDYIPRNHETAGADGRIVQIAFLKSSKVEVDFRRLMLKRLTHTGSTLRSRSVPEKAAIARALEQTVLPLIAEGRCRPVMDATFPLDDVRKAHERMDGGEHIGKIVLTM